MGRLLRTRLRGQLLRTRLRAQKGFTLIEMMIVVNILGILTLIMIPAFVTLKGRAEDGANKANVRNVLTLIDAYFQDNQSYSGMTLATLQTSYDQGLEVSKYGLASVSGTTYCVQSPATVGAHTWRKNGPGALFERDHC